MHVFRGNARDWGFCEYASSASLQPGQYADGEMNVVIMVKIRLQVDSPVQLQRNTSTWSSRKPSGFVGSKKEDTNYPPSTKFLTILRRYNTIDKSKVHSPWHLFGGFRWRLLIFPKGNHASKHHISLYLECGGPVPPKQTSTKVKEEAHIPTTQWSRPAKFSLHVVHPASPVAKDAMRGDLYRLSATFQDLELADSDIRLDMVSRSDCSPRDIVKKTMHEFRDNACNWGFVEFAPFASLQAGQFADDDMNVVIMVKIPLQDDFPDPTLSQSP